MRKIREKFLRFIYGRYGVDELYKFSMVLLLVIWIADLITSIILPAGNAKLIVSFCFMIVMAGLISWITFRMLSKNIYKRRQENERYIKAQRAVIRTLCFNTSRKSKGKNADTYEYIFRDCTNCGSTLRLPRKEGKNRVKCPRCNHSFFVVSKKYKKG